MVVQNVGIHGHADISFTVPRHELKRTLAAVETVLDQISATGMTHDDQVSKVSVVGLNMETQTNVAARMFRALADAGVNSFLVTFDDFGMSEAAAQWAIDEGITLFEAVESEDPTGLIGLPLIRLSALLRAQGFELP